MPAVLATWAGTLSAPFQVALVLSPITLAASLSLQVALETALQLSVAVAMVVVFGVVAVGTRMRARGYFPRCPRVCKADTAGIARYAPPVLVWAWRGIGTRWHNSW